MSGSYLFTRIGISLICEPLELHGRYPNEQMDKLALVTFTTVLENFDSNLWKHHIVVPGKLAAQFIEGDNRRVICTLQEQVSIHAALMPSGENYFILVNNEVRKQLAAEEGDELRVKLEKDHSEFGMPLAEELAVLLAQDAEGARYFRALTMGKQRTLVHVVGKVKSPESRLNKSMAIMQHLKEVKGELDFKRLNLLIKEVNQRGRLRG